VSARWIVLTPSALDNAWREALSRAGAAAGLTLVDAVPPPSEPALADPRTVVLTDDAAAVPDTRGGQAAAILPDPSRVIEALAARDGVAVADAVWSGSRILAQACALPEDCPVLAGAALSHGAVEVLPGLIVEPPQGANATPDTPLSIALGLYREGRPQPGATAEWAPEVFLYDARAARDAKFAGDLDATGRPRIAVYGPFIELPAGRWQADIRFALDEPLCSRQLRIDWGTQTDYVSETVIAGQPGVFQMQLEWTWTAPAPAEARILIIEGVFDGRLMFQGLTVRRLPDLPTEPAPQSEPGPTA
jgi:hypothetical protein